MSSAYPASSSQEPRAAEPSMEEILASIRRIIADDQSLPGHGSLRVAPEPVEPPADPAPAPEPLHPPAAIHVLHPETAQGPISDSPAPAAPVETPAPVKPHGQVTAPQFPSPAGPAVDEGEPLDAAPAEASSTPETVQPAALGETVAAHEPTAGAAQAGHSFVDPEEPDLDDYMEPIGQMPAPESNDHALFSETTHHSVTSAFNMLAATRLADNSDDLLAMTRDMIRPMLKAWLDDNLPSMVERLVRAEIERVSRGGR